MAARDEGEDGGDMIWFGLVGGEWRMCVAWREVCSSTCSPTFSLPRHAFVMRDSLVLFT
jgi:hypothetical protein